MYPRDVYGDVLPVWGWKNEWKYGNSLHCTPHLASCHHLRLRIFICKHSFVAAAINRKRDVPARAASLNRLYSFDCSLPYQGFIAFTQSWSYSSDLQEIWSPALLSKLSDSWVKNERNEMNIFSLQVQPMSRSTCIMKRWRSHSNQLTCN